MRNAFTKMMALTAVLFVGMAFYAQAEDMSLDIGGGVDIMSDYVWRGQLLTDEPVVQPYVDVGLEGLTLSAWGSIDTTDVNERGSETYNFQEMDYTLSYAVSPTEGIDLEGGGIYYDFPGTGASGTAEVFLSGTLSNVLLTPSATVYYDVDEVDGVYAKAQVGHTFGLTERLGLNLSAGLGWGDQDYNDAYFGVSDSEVNDLALDATLEYEVNEVVSISGYLGYSTLLGSSVEDAGEDAYGDSDILSGGIGLSFTY